MAIRHRDAVRHRIWIVRYVGKTPDDWHDLPASGVALEPAEPGALPEKRARKYVEAFNRAALDRRQNVWAIAVPVTLRYEGDLTAGDVVGREVPEASV